MAFVAVQRGVRGRAELIQQQETKKNDLEKTNILRYNFKKTWYLGDDK